MNFHGVGVGKLTIVVIEVDRVSPLDVVDFEVHFVLFIFWNLKDIFYPKANQLHCNKYDKISQKMSLENYLQGQKKQGVSYKLNLFRYEPHCGAGINRLSLQYRQGGY